MTTPPDTDGQGGEIMTRDLSAGAEEGPGLTQFETPSARGGPNRTTGIMERERPQYSPVAQPGMNENIWFHTVEQGGMHEPDRGRKRRRRKGRRRRG